MCVSPSVRHFCCAIELKLTLLLLRYPSFLFRCLSYIPHLFDISLSVVFVFSCEIQSLKRKISFSIFLYVEKKSCRLFFDFCSCALFCVQSYLFAPGRGSFFWEGFHFWPILTSLKQSFPAFLSRIWRWREFPSSVWALHYCRFLLPFY